MGMPFTHRLARLTVLTLALVALLWLALARAGPARAAGVVGDGTPASCTGTALESVINAGSGNISFNCGPNPVIITITHNGGLNIPPGSYNTIDGANRITLSGAGTHRLFDVRVGGALTLTNIVLTDGYQDGITGNLPDLGGAILDEGVSLTLDHVTIRNSQSVSYGGGIEVITGTVVINDSLIEGNQSQGGGGIDSAGPLTLNSRLSIRNTTLRDNHATTSNGGALAISRTITISDSQIYSNTADSGIGGGIYALGTLTLTNVLLNGNTAARGGGLANHAGTVTLDHCTVSGNHATQIGGGLYNDLYGPMTHVSNCTVAGNSAGDGGGFYLNSFSSATVNNSVLDSNTATEGGGMFFYHSQATLTGSTLRANSAITGGGIYVYDGGPELDYSTLSGNSATGDGGGIYLSYVAASAYVSHSVLSGNSAGGNGGGIFAAEGGIILDYSTLSGNSAAHGGGIYSSGAIAYVSVHQTTFSGNTAAQQGGGVYVSTEIDYRPVDLTNSTLSGNSALLAGGGIYNRTDIQLWNVTLSNNSAASGGGLFSVSGYTTALTNTILAYSASGGNCGGAAISVSKYNLSSDSTCALAGTGDHINLDPMLTALGNYGGETEVHMLMLGSPAIDGVVGSDAPSSDQRGIARPQGSGFDIGAVERQPSDVDTIPRLWLPLIER